MTKSIIVAISDNNAIGRDNSLLWHIPEDLKYFKRTTTGCPVIMGRRTFESIGKPLPGRFNIVVTRSGGLSFPDGVAAASSLDEAFSMAEEHGGEQCFVIGGGEIYRQALPIADRLYVTHVHTVMEDADTYFPEISPDRWEKDFASDRMTDVKSGLGFEFAVYGRKF